MIDREVCGLNFGQTCIHYFSCYYEKMPGNTQFKERNVSFDLVLENTAHHGGKAWWQGAEAAVIAALQSGSRESGKEVGLSYKTSHPTHSNPLPPARLPFLKVPQLSKTLPLADDKVFKSTSLWGCCMFRGSAAVSWATPLRLQLRGFPGKDAGDPL